MKKKFVRLISAVLSAAMTLTAVPLSAFAEGEAHTHDGESNVITTPLDFREKKADENGDGWSWVYDTKTLTLDGVNIQATTDSMSVVTVPDGTEIVLNGNNTIVQTNTGDSDTYVLSAVNTNDVNCDGTMTISGDGVLNAENRSTDSMARSLGGSIILNGGTVNATGTVKTNSLEIHNDGVLNANATTASFEGVAVNVSGGITVDGNGSLTAVGCANESTLNSAILLTGNSGDKISVSGNGSITVPESNKARVGIYYSGNNGDGMDAEISGGKVTAYGTKYGIYKVNLIMNGTGSVYTTGGSYAIGQTVPTIDENEFVIKGSTEFKASESAVTGEVKYNSGYYEIGGADAKTVVIKPDTSPRIILGKQTGIFKTEEYEIIEGMTDTKLKGTVYFDITLKNMSDEEFADARGYFGGDEPDLSASIIKTDYGWVCMVCDTEFSVTYDTDNTLTIKCGDIVSNTVQVKSNANRFNKVTQGDNTNRTVFYTNTSQEEKDNYKLVSTYTVDSESISYNWYSTNSAYSADELGAAVSGSNGEFKLADNIPAGNYVLYCDITYSDGDSTETVTEKFTFTYKECAHENGYSDGKCTNCGALCDHSNIDIDTGKCNKCEHQFVATISTDGNAPTGYDTLADCLNSITADTGNYVKIYQDIGDASATATLDTIDVKHNVMIDLNGHKLNNIKLGVNKLGVNKDVTLTLTGTAGSYVTQVYVRKGGSFVIDSDANVEFNTIFVEDSAQLAVSDGAKVTTEQLTVIASVADDGTTTTSVKLATGMKLGGLTYHRQNNSGALKLGNLLDVTRQALQREDNGNYLDLYKEYGSMGYSVALTVVEHTDADHKYGSGTGKCEECGKPCEHGGDINTDTGICSVCGAVVSVALYTDKNGSLKYVDTDELDSLLNEYNGSGTIKLFKDYSKPSAQYDLYGELTIDLNGRQFKIRSITPCKSGKLTIKNSGNPVMLGCNVYPTNDASYAGGTLIIDGDVVLDTSIYVYDSSTVILKAGAYPAGLYARDSKTLYDMLGEGKAFFKADGTLFNASVKEISSSETLTVKAHSHTYVDGKCGCGYVCTHSDVDIDTGKCTECEYQYAAVIVKDGAVASVYKETEMEAAFEAADSDANTGCILKVYKNYTGSYTTLSGKFTLWIAEKANVGTLTVSGDITVTGSGKNNRIYGDFNVAASGKLTFDENCGAMGTVSVGAGTFDCYSTFSITLNINDASSDVILHGGAFKTICYNGGGDRANAEILTLLAENRMFMKSPNPEPIDGSKTLLKDGFATTVIVIPHEGHSYDSTTGKCTICGKRCGHTDVDSKTGVCSTCKYQLTAGISGAGTAKYFDNIDDAFTAALSAENNGCTLTLYKHCEITQSVEIGQATVTVDVNGYSLGGEADISVNNGGVLYLKDSRKSTYYGCIDAPFSVNGGTLINGTADGGSSAADVLNLVINSAKCVEIYGGIFENVYIAHASGVALYGGRYNTICGEESNRTPVNDLLAKGYAFATVQEFTTLPESIVDGSAKTIGGRLTNVTVVAHTHTYNETNTKCACGAVLYAKVTSADGTTNEYFDSIEEGLLYADKAENKGCVFTLVTSGKIKDYVTLSNGQFTITAMNNNCVISASGGKICIEGADVIAEGHMLINCSIDMISGSLTLPEGSGTRFGTIIISGGTVNISEGVNADNNAGADKLFIANATTDAKVTIGGGTYGNVVFEPFKLKDVLASGVRVIRYDNPSDPTAEKIVTALLYSDIAEESYLAPGDDDGRYYLVTKCEHKNEDGSYAFNEGGICKYCNSEFAASVSYTDGGEKTELFSNICDAFDKANEAGTATITLCRDIADSEIAHEINVTGNVTLALNGKTLGATDKAKKIYICGSTLTVNGNGKVWSAIEAKPDSKLTITNGEYYDVYALSDSEVVILDGIIDCLSVYGTGKAEVSGGKFKYLFMYNGKAIESVLADGYAYKNADGTWLSIDEREKDSYLGGSKGALSVEEAPIKSATISAENESPIIYRNGKKASTFAADVTYSGNETLYITGCLIDGTVISEKTELLNGYCYLLGDQVDKAVAEDGEIQYYCIFTYDGYEYKSNVVTLTVATCRHPGESVKCDDNGCVCGICNRALPASVELSDGTLSYYDNWNDAIGAAEESEGCTLKLLNYSGLKDNETFDISKGRFTVDLNKNDGNTAFTFNVKGGDITFTAPQKASSSLTGVTVSGENANVLIDSKATLNYLVVNSGKVSADGANIGAITINGGDTVINDVNADYLSMKADTTGGSGYNVSIVSGTFNIFTCENESNYTLGRAIASGSRVIGLNAIVGSGFKYAEIQSMTKANYLNVIKCDHKDENDSYALDGNLCPYCNEEIAATVSYTTANGGEQTDLFSDIYDAFDKANEAGTATVTLYKDITNSELTQGVTITGNVTLALNGKKLGGTFAFNAPVEVSDGGMFTVGGDGKMRMPIKAYANSKLIINGGEFTSVMVYIDGDAEIGGGVIDALTIIGNAKAKISGGKFYNIEIANGSLESVLADGYAYKKDGGAWLSIAERAESVYSSVNNDNKPVNVEEAPIKSATLSTEMNKLYRNSNANPTLKFNLSLANGSNLNDSYVSKRYGINSYVSGDIIYSSLSALVKDAKLSADEIIDKAGDSDVAEIYFVVTTGDGYEIKSNTVSIDLVDCDHSQVVDPTADKETAGNITEPTYCEICESKFNAKITKGDDVRYYNNLDEAAKDAQKSENEGCTLYPLYNKNGYGGQLVITEGNFTLKYAVRTAFSRPIIINGKAKLTVTGRCAVTAFENQDAFIVQGGDVTFDGLATGSNVTINGGNVTMAANNINCLTINGGNVSISSGGFAEIVTTVSDKVIADYIDHGFWVQDRETKEWIDIYSLNKATASSTNGLTVRLCPMQIIKPIDTVYYTNGYYPGDIPSLQINAEPWYSNEVDAKVAYQWFAIDENGYETVIEGATDRKLSLENLTTGRYYCRLTYSNATTAGVSMASDVVTATITECEHSGGEATCTEKAKCEICGAEYGEPLGHDYVVIKVVEPDYRNEGYSVFECTRCKDSYIGNRVPVKPIPDVEEIAVEKTTYNEVDISWKNISGVDGYYVECYVGNQWKQIGFSTDGDRVAAKLSGLSAGLKYKVRIAAYAGSFTAKFRCFYVDTVPSPVWNINTVKATDETVRISWSRNARADGYKVEWYINNQWSVKTVTGNNNISAVIDGLCAGTRYKVRVSAYKGDLYSPYTYGYIDTLPSKVTGITKTVTSSSFTLKWDKNESADGYTAQYYADGKWNEKTLTGNNKTTVTIGSLKGYKTYKVRIKAYKGELESAFDDIYITTAPTKVSGLKVKSAVDSKAVVIWNADANADGYNVEYYIGGKWVKKTITDNKTAKAVLGGLTPYITYKVRVRAYKDNLYGDYSYTTVTAVLSPVTNIKVVSAKRNSITVKWGKNASADGYKVEIYKGGKWVKKTLKGSTNATVTIGGLRAGSVYKVRIASYKGANTSTYTYANVKTAK